MAVMNEKGVYSPSELMIIASSRELKSAHVVFVGIGLPNVACNLARRTVAPDLELVYEAGVFGACPTRLPLSIGDPCLVTGATSVASMPQLFQYYLQRGLIDVGFLGAAQIDRHGNINTTVIGKYERPIVRLPGSGGACDIMLLAKKVLIICQLNKRAFVEKVDFITSPGCRLMELARQSFAGYGMGPAAVITDMGILRANENGELVLAAIYPGVSIDVIKQHAAWNLEISDQLTLVAPPTEQEIAVLRTELDSRGIYR